MDKELATLVSKFLEGQEPKTDMIHVNLTLNAEELKEVGSLLSKLRDRT